MNWNVGKMKYRYCSYNLLLYHKPAQNLVASRDNYFIIFYDFNGISWAVYDFNGISWAILLPHINSAGLHATRKSRWLTIMTDSWCCLLAGAPCDKLLTA